MNIIQALNDPDLFGKFFPPRTRNTPTTFVGDTWARWRVMLTAMFGLPMSDDQVAIYQHHTGRAKPLDGPARKVALITGRRAAKSRLLATVAVYLAIVPDYSADLAPGETPTILIVASDKKQARTIFRYVRGLLNGVDMLRPMIETETAESITLTNGICIEVMAANYRTLRGYTLVAALVDEVAFLRDETGANPDQEIINAIEPALGTLNGMLIIASTPYWMKGFLYTVFKANFGQQDADWLVWRGTTGEMNPTYPAHLIAEAYADDPARAAAEYGAEFRSDLASFVAREVVESCTIPGRHELSRLPGARYVGFVDPSGGSSDSMTLAIAHRAGDVAILDAIREVRPPFSPEGVVTDFAVLLKSYGLTAVTGDRYAGEWPRERFRVHGIDYQIAESVRSDIYRDLLPILNSGRCELLDLPRLSNQLCGLERRTARSGRDSIDHGPGGHDDIANAAAGALLLAKIPPSQPARMVQIGWMQR